MCMNDTTKDYLYAGTFYMPDGSVMPELLVPREALLFLRLDTGKSKKPEGTLQYYRDKGLLRATRVGNNVCYQKKELLRFLDLLTEQQSKNNAME